MIKLFDIQPSAATAITTPVLKDLEVAHEQFKLFKQNREFAYTDEGLADDLLRQSGPLGRLAAESEESRSLVMWAIIFGLQIPYASTG